MHLKLTRDATKQRAHKPNSADSSHSTRHVILQNTDRSDFIQRISFGTLAEKIKSMSHLLDP